MIMFDAMSMWESLILFVVAGVIPGTSLAISPLIMLILFLLGLLIVVISFTTTVEFKSTNERSLPKKRYSQV
jgi:hypothetical protein